VTLLTRGKTPVTQQIPDDTDESYARYKAAVKHIAADRSDYPALVQKLKNYKFDGTVVLQLTNKMGQDRMGWDWSFGWGWNGIWRWYDSTVTYRQSGMEQDGMGWVSSMVVGWNVVMVHLYCHTPTRKRRKRMGWNGSRQWEWDGR
jgi:hypothetical protein